MHALVGQAALSKEELLDAAGLMVEFSRAEGDLLYCEDADKDPAPVIDLVGGFGCTLLGHNHPELKALLTSCLEQNRPMHAQGSRRRQAEELKQALADFLLESTGEHYRIVVLNTGTEAVEAAIKHARYAFGRRLEAVAVACGENLRSFTSRLSAGNVEVTPEFLRECERRLGEEPIESGDELVSALLSHNRRNLAAQPLMAALPHAFHGKTLGSLALTWNRDARLAFVRNNDDVVFVHAPVDFLASVAEESIRYWQLEFHPLRLIVRSLPRLAALIYEPLRGEGGVLDLDGPSREMILSLHARYPDVALIADEVQCGLGRTGEPVVSAAQGLPADYLTFAKSLGGGLVKISALAVRDRLYHGEFGMLHSSTFAEDDLSAVIARRSIEIIRRDDIASRCAAIGEELHQGLEALQRRYPKVVAAVRGRGCMLGLELRDLADHRSALLASLSRENLLGMVCAGHLLHQHRIRVLPSLGRRAVLRIQPSAYLDKESIARALAAFDATFRAIDDVAVDVLVGHLKQGGFRPPAAPAAPAVLRGGRYGSEERIERVGFLAHLIDPQSVREWEPGLAGFDDEAIGELKGRIQSTLEPHLIASRRVRSVLGREIELRVYGIMMDSESIELDIQFHRARQVRQQVDRACELAREDGCGLVGFGGYTSIVTGNCTSLGLEAPAVTTGNSLTVASSLAAARRRYRRMGLDLSEATVAVVGATGNIGSVLGRLLAPLCARLLLVGRTGGEARIDRLIHEIACDLLGRGPDGLDQPGFRAEQLTAWWRANRDPVPTSLARWMREKGWIAVATDPLCCREADIVFGTSSSSRPILTSSHFDRDRPVLVCDVAVPGDVDTTGLEQLSRLSLIRGGVVRLPMAPDFSLPGMQLAPGQIYACAAETVLLGLAGIRADFSKGAIRPQQVLEIAELARLHGFEIDHEKRIGGFRSQ